METETKTFKKIKKTFGFTREEAIKKNLEEVAFYDKAKKRGKTKKTDSIVEKYRKNGKVIENNRLMQLFVYDIPGLPLRVKEEYHFPKKTYISFDLENGWTASKNDKGEWNICHSADNVPEDDSFANVIEFAKQQGIPLQLETLKEQIQAVLCGHKVNTLISPEWGMFSPFIDNGIILQFCHDADQFKNIYNAQTSDKQEVLTELAKDPDVCVRLNVAYNPNTSLETLSALAKDQHVNVRESVAENPHTSAGILSELAKDQDHLVRRYVAENRNTPTEILSELAKDQVEDVRFFVALNPNTPLETLSALAKDQYEDVRYKAEDSLARKQAAEDESAEMSM